MKIAILFIVCLVLFSVLYFRNNPVSGVSNSAIDSIEIFALPRTDLVAASVKRENSDFPIYRKSRRVEWGQNYVPFINAKDSVYYYYYYSLKSADTIDRIKEEFKNLQMVKGDGIYTDFGLVCLIHHGPEVRQLSITKALGIYYGGNYYFTNPIILNSIFSSLPEELKLSWTKRE